MSDTTIIVRYQKIDAVFLSADAANLDRFVNYADLLNESRSANQKMLADGTLAQPIDYVWNPDTFILTLTKIVTNMDDYTNTYGLIQSLVESASQANGWTLL
jgi:hypothetical protein